MGTFSAKLDFLKDSCSFNLCILPSVFISLVDGKWKLPSLFFQLIIKDFIFKDIGSEMDPNAFNRIEVFYIYNACCSCDCSKGILKKMNGRKQKQTGCLENIV